MKRISRRTMLRGIGGATLALPALEIFGTRAVTAAPPPQRYVIMFGGSSFCAGDNPQTAVIPDAEGPLSERLTRALQPLEEFQVASATSFVSGLKLPWAENGRVPAGGRVVKFHAQTTGPLLSGMRTQNESERIHGATSDWVVAEQIAGPTMNTRPVLAYRVQPAYYRAGNGTDSRRGTMSVRMRDGQLEEVPPLFSPRVAFRDLFANFTPQDGQDAAEAEFLLERRRSVIDLVREDTERLLPKLGQADKARLARHFDELRALENRLDSLQLEETEVCRPVADPGPDAAIGNAVDNGDTGGYESGGAYSNEEARAEVLVDLIHMAFACDLSRVSSLMLTFSQCFMNMQPLFGYASDLHELGHFALGSGPQGVNAVADGVGWHVKHFARLMRKLDDTPDADGTSMLDNTALVLVFEGGVGFDPEQGKMVSPHSSENMGVLIGGRAGGLNRGGGQHLRMTDRHPTRVINTAMAAVGVRKNLGEVDGIIPGLGV